MSKIAWTNKTWNPVVGCTKISSGCDNCYAERMAVRQSYMADARLLKNYSQLNIITAMAYGKAINKKTRKWTGKTGMNRYHLNKPLHWKKPLMIFVSSMGDLFHESVPFEFIAKVTDVIRKCPQHTFQILTKRAQRMHDYFHHIMPDHFPPEMQVLKNLWIGVTAENQEQADKRIPILLQTPAAVRFVSIEPMLEAVDIKKYVSLRMRCFGKKGCGFTGPSDEFVNPKRDGAYRCPKCRKTHSYFITNSLDWVIVGAESGPGKRYIKSAHIHDITCQCKAAGVPCFVKQLHDDNTKKLIKEPAGWPRKYPKGGE